MRGCDRPANDPPGEIFPLVHIVIPPLLDDSWLIGRGRVMREGDEKVGVREGVVIV